MKKKHLLIFAVVLVVIGVAIGIFFGFLNNDRGKNIELNLDDLNSANEFVYCGIPWGTSYIDAVAALPSSLEKDAHRTPAPEGYAFYVTKNAFTLEGQSTKASFQFHNECLETVQFSFNVEKDHQIWFEDRVSELTDLYGAPTDKKKNDNGKLSSTNYIWESGNSRLQATLITGLSTPSVSITISATPQTAIAD